MRLVIERRAQPCSSKHSKAPRFWLAMWYSANVDDQDLPMLLETRHWALDTVVQNHNALKPANTRLDPESNAEPSSRVLA